MRRTSSTVIMSSDVSRAVRQRRGCARGNLRLGGQAIGRRNRQGFQLEPRSNALVDDHTVAIVGAIVGDTSLIMSFFYQPSPPPTTIESGHSEFMKLS